MPKFSGSRPLLLGPALLVAGVCSSIAAPPARAALGPDYYGATIQPMFGAVPSDRWPAFLTQMAGDGLREARFVAPWASVEQTAPEAGRHSYEWWAIDSLAVMLALRGLRMNPVLAVAPGWAAGTGTQIAPQRYADFAAFAGAFAARYGSRGTFWAAHPELPAQPVTNYEIWTEANSTNFWTGRRNATEYVNALKPMTPAIHTADPRGLVLASIGWQDYAPYLDAMYAAGAKGLIDGIGFHPYAPFAAAIIDLARGLRSTLVRDGDGALPIFLTETGQPRTPSGPGATTADSGLVSDEARAASQSLTGDALARSDCDVRNDILFGNVASETSREPISEGYMGIHRITDAQPNATGAAIRDAQARWRADMRQPLVLCNQGVTPRESLLPLRLDLDHDYPTCVNGRTTYFGNSLEGSQLTLTTVDGRSFAQRTNAFGVARVCFPDGPPVTSFEVHSEVQNVAGSATYSCPTSGGPCTAAALPRAAGASSPDQGAVLAATASKPKRCEYLVALKIFQRTRKRARLSAGMSCRDKAGHPGTLRFKVSTQRRGAPKKVMRRTLTLQGKQRRALTLRIRLRHGDKVFLIRFQDRARSTPGIVRSVKVTRARRAR